MFSTSLHKAIHGYNIYPHRRQTSSPRDELEAYFLRSQADSEKLMEAVVGRMLADSSE